MLCKTCLIESRYFEKFSLEVHEIDEEWYFNYVLAAHINKFVRFSLLRRRSLVLQVCILKLPRIFLALHILINFLQCCSN